MRMLILEDERALTTILKRHLEAEGHEVEIANDGDTGIARATEARFDLILLDLNLPGCDGSDGIEVIRTVRQSDESAAIMVLSGRAGLEDRLKCFELGADDWLAKPFALRELTVRVRALSRRTRATPDPVLRCADLELNPLRRSVVRSGRKIDLSAREYALAEYLIQHKGRCVPRTTLLKQVWDMPEQSGTNVVEVYVNYLRRKVDQGFPKPLIHTVRGEGYVLREVNVASPHHPTGAEPGALWHKAPARQPYSFPAGRSA